MCSPEACETCGADQSDDVFYCGHPTKSGGECRRKVANEGDTCYQHPLYPSEDVALGVGEDARVVAKEEPPEGIPEVDLEGYLNQAARERLAVWIQYVNERGVVSGRTVEPWHLAPNKDGDLYMKAYDRLTKGRHDTFRLDRILRCVPNGEAEHNFDVWPSTFGLRYTRPFQGPLTQKYVDAGWADGPPGFTLRKVQQ
jgi:hypothetical protein